MSWPVGTPEEVRKAGFSVELTPCCAPIQSKNPDEARSGNDLNAGGCKFWRRLSGDGGMYECAFALKKNGGFRGKDGPKHVGVMIKCDPSEVASGQLGPATNTIVTPCYLFEANLRDRYEAQTKTGEVIAIIAQEGETMPYLDERRIPDPVEPGKTKREYFLNREFVVPKLAHIGENDPFMELRNAAVIQASKDKEEVHEARTKDALNSMMGKPSGK